MSNDDAHEIRIRMASVRAKLSHDVQQVGVSARAMTDWRYYPRHFPWATVALTALVGYLVVPKRTEIISPDPETLAKLSDQNRLVVQRKPKAQAAQSFSSHLVSLVSAGLMRAATAYVGQGLTGMAMRAKEKGPQATNGRARRTSP